MTDEELADLKLIHQAGRRSLVVSGVLLLSLGLVAPLSLLPFGTVVMKVVLMGFVSPLFVLGWTAWRVNTARIGEGKTSICFSRYPAANHHHGFNQGLNLFSMGAGLLLIGGMTLVDFTPG